MGHALMENRNGLAVGGVLTHAAETAEPLAQGLPLGPKTLGADKGYDSRDFVMELRDLSVTPHIAQNAYATERATRRSDIDRRTTRHPSYALSQRKWQNMSPFPQPAKAQGGSW